MAEYIERESLINHIEDLPVWGADGDMLDRQDVISSIENRPAADVAPVVHGWWYHVQEKRIFGDHYLLCSNCKSINGTMIPFNFCPNCGSEMDGGEDNADD